MTLRARLAGVKQIAEGDGVSYGHTWIADRDTVVGLVPLGYGDGIPTQAGNAAVVGVGGRTVPIRGRVCMDQFVVELGPGATDQVGDEVTLFGSGTGPSAEDWAQACGTIGYEIVTRIGVRVPREYH
jgi:alanine racemase